jgi:hypothetical protein
MSIEKFTGLLKKELLRQATASEQNELQAMLEQEENYTVIYKEVFSGRAGAINRLEIEAAFARHWNRLKK